MQVVSLEEAGSDRGLPGAVRLGVVEEIYAVTGSKPPLEL